MVQKILGKSDISKETKKKKKIRREDTTQMHTVSQNEKLLDDWTKGQTKTKQLK